MIKKITFLVGFLCAILFVNSLYAMYNSNGKRDYSEEQNQENKKRTKYDDVDQSNLNTPIIEQGNDIFVFDKDVTQSLQVNTFAKSLIFKVYPSEDQLTKIGLKFPNVQKIDISDILRNVSSDRKKKFLRELLNFQALKELICNNNMLTDIELSILPAFTHAPNNDNWLESIHLNQNLITDKGAKNIALMGRKLTKLSITHNQIEESGALSIVKMPQLKKLSLDKNLISDESWHNIQKIATEKNLIFIENKEDFFKQTFTDNFVLNNEPKIQQTLIQNFTPVLPLNVHNGPYSIPLENPYYVNNNNNQVVQNQNIKNDTYVFDREAKKTIGSFPKGGTIHINTIIFKIIPSSKQLDCIKSYYKDVNKIDMSILFGKNFLNIRRIKNDTWRSLLIDLKEFLMLKYEDADFNQFIENSYDQEPQNPFDFEKSRLYAERELFRKKDIRNVFINALFEESENSNNQIVTSQKQNNYTPLVNLQQNNSNNVKNKEQKENAKNNVYIFDCETKKTIESFPKGATIHINTIIFKIIPSFKQLYYIKSHYKNINKIDMSVLFGKKFSNIHRIKNDRPRSLLADLEEFLMLKYEDANFNQFIENSHCSEPQKPFDFEKSRLYAERELFRKKDIRNVFVNALFAEAENSSNQIVASQNLNNFSPQVNEQRHNSNIAQNVTQRQPQNITPNQQMPMPNNYAPSVNPQQYNLNNGQNMQRMLPQNVTPNPQISMPNNCAPPVNLQQNNSNNVENKEKKENTKNNIYIFDLKAKRKLQKDNLSLENTINTIILKIVPTRSDIKRLHKKYEFTKKIDASTLFGEKYSNINEDPNIKASLFNQLINFLEYKAINRHANNNEKFIFFVKEAKFTEPKIPFDIEKSSLNEKKEYIKRSCNPNVFINALFKESENSSIEQNKKNNVYVFDLEEKRKINFEDRLQTEHIDTIIFKIIPSTKYINFLSKNYKNIKKIDTSSLFGKKFLNIEMDSSIKASLITQLEIFTNCISDKQNNSGFSSFVDQAKKIEPRKPFDIEKSYLNEKKEYIKGCYNPNVFINALFAESEYSNNQIVTSQNLNNFSPQVNEQQHNSNIKRNVEFQKVTPNPQTPTPNNSMYQLNGQQHNSNIVPQGQPQKVTPNKQIPNNYAWQVNVQRTNSNNFENKDQKENSKNNVYVFDLEEKRKVKTERQLQQINMDEIIFKIIPPPKIINFLRKNKSYIKKIDASPIFGKKYSNIIPNLYIKKSLFSQFDDFIKNITAFNDNEIDISGFVKEAKENEPKKPLDIEKSRIYKERELFKEKNYPNVFINALFAESENSNNQIAASQNPNNFRPPVNAQQHNSNIGQNVQQRQPHNVMFNPQTPMPNNYAPQVNKQQHNLNIGQNVQRMQPQNVMPNPQMPTPNNYAPQVNTQQYNSNNVQRMQPHNMMLNPQMPIQNLASNTLIITEEKNNNDSDYKELLDLFYSEDIQNPVCNALEDAMFSFGNNERAFLQQGKPILLERKINFLHFEICPTENEIFQLFQNFNFIEKINISFALPKDKIDRIKILTALKIFQNLKELTAEGNELTDEDIICIAQGLPCLTLLNVDNNLIGDNGAVYVSCMQNLKELYVKSNKIKDKGAREIATMDNLEVFYYDNNEITPLGHKDIEELRKDVLFMHSLI
ncbi:MAG: hypothetical protein Q8L85_00090 [Alphaproteobacteria bacterium]|nr:hypothetical protein [Alphaproteobacteria bacterium]